MENTSDELHVTPFADFIYCLAYKIRFLFQHRGTHGYMAPEVLSKGTAYDSSADWFSFGCMLYKLLKGHSPFRQHKTRDKHEIDRMTLTMVSLKDDLYCIYTCMTFHYC